MKHILTVVLTLLSFSFIQASEYGYPIKKPLFATIIGTPPKLTYKVKDAPVKVYCVESLSKFKLPEIMWDVKGARFSAATHDKKAPLIFIVAGTGANYDNSTMKFLQNAFYQNGFHVICINSPITRNFTATCSTSAIPGITPYDAKDLYRLMKRAYKEVKGDIAVSDFYLLGYSLGGLESAFISKLDETEKAFNFKKVLLINTPVNIYQSIRLLDSYLPLNVKPNEDILSIMMDKLAIYFAKRGEVGFGPNFLLEVNKLSPVTPSEAKRLIGATFQLFLAETVFVSDILNDKKLIVKKKLTISDPLLPYFKDSLLWDFEHYVNYFVLPYWKLNNPNKTKADLIYAASLRALKEYLKNSDKIAIVHNIDDIILSPEDLKFLKETFKGRAKFYPRGGHCGNIEYKTNAEYMINYFK